MKFQADAKGIYLRASYYGFKNDNYEVKTDFKRLAQVVMILQSNALKFTFEGGVDFRVIKSNKKLTIKVRDTGVGIK